MNPSNTTNSCDDTDSDDDYLSKIQISQSAAQLTSQNSSFDRSQSSLSEISYKKLVAEKSEGFIIN